MVKVSAPAPGKSHKRQPTPQNLVPTKRVKHVKSNQSLSDSSYHHQCFSRTTEWLHNFCLILFHSVSYCRCHVCHMTQCYTGPSSRQSSGLISLADMIWSSVSSAGAWRLFQLRQYFAHTPQRPSHLLLNQVAVSPSLQLCGTFRLEPNKRSEWRAVQNHDTFLSSLQVDFHVPSRVLRNPSCLINTFRVACLPRSLDRLVALQLWSRGTPGRSHYIWWGRFIPFIDTNES